MNTGFGFFPYEAMNYKAAQAWLDRKAGQGWGLRHVYMGCIARLQRMERPSHFVDLDIRSSFDGDTDPDYLQLCSDAGWELVQQLRGMLLFRSAPGTSPAPIQTDDGLEWERFWEKYRPRIWLTLVNLLCLGFLAVMLSISSTMSTTNMTAGLSLNSCLLYALYLALMIVYIALEWGHSRWYLARCRRSNQVEDPGPVSTFVDTLARLRIPILCLILVSPVIDAAFGTTVNLGWYPINKEYTATAEACQEWPVVMASDLDLPGNVYSRRLEGHRTVLMDFLDYSELIDREEPDAPLYVLTTERYECVSEGLAKWVLSHRREETRKGAFLWGELEWEPASFPNFDACYTCREGSYLLLRQGKVVALVGCSGLDLTTVQSLEIVQERIWESPQ